jgi:ubiquinone/menaquinone biosynthesis C-methylase UbiE
MRTPGGSVAEDHTNLRANVVEYWEKYHESYLKNVGKTFQAGEMRTPAGGDDFRDSNRCLAGRAGIRPGHRVLDAGCGVCGPSIDIASVVERISIAAITISPKQARTARSLIAEARVADCVQVLLADFHELPYAGGSFDVVFFFESAGYSYAPGRLFAEVCRVLKPGGTVYIKDVFRREDPLTAAEQEELRDFDEVFSQWTPAMGETIRAMRDAGFVDVAGSDLTGMVTTKHVLEAMLEVRDGEWWATDFAERHFRQYRCLPIYYGEVRGEKPEQPQFRQ